MSDMRVGGAGAKSAPMTPEETKDLLDDMAGYDKPVQASTAGNESYYNPLYKKPKKVNFDEYTSIKAKDKKQEAPQEIEPIPGAEPAQKAHELGVQLPISG